MKKDNEIIKSNLNKTEIIELKENINYIKNIIDNSLDSTFETTFVLEKCEEKCKSIKEAVIHLDKNDKKIFTFKLMNKLFLESNKSSITENTLYNIVKIII